MSKRSDIISAYIAIIGIFLLILHELQYMFLFLIVPWYILLSVLFLLHVHDKCRDKH